MTGYSLKLQEGRGLGETQRASYVSIMFCLINEKVILIKPGCSNISIHFYYSLNVSCQKCFKVWNPLFTGKALKQKCIYYIHLICEFMWFWKFPVKSKLEFKCWIVCYRFLRIQVTKKAGLIGRFSKEKNSRYFILTFLKTIWK